MSLSKNVSAFLRFIGTAHYHDRIVDTIVLVTAFIEILLLGLYFDGNLAAHKNVGIMIMIPTYIACSALLIITFVVGNMERAKKQEWKKADGKKYVSSPVDYLRYVSFMIYTGVLVAAIIIGLRLDGDLSADWWVTFIPLLFVIAVRAFIQGRKALASPNIHVNSVSGAAPSSMLFLPTGN